MALKDDGIIYEDMADWAVDQGSLNRGYERPTIIPREYSAYALPFPDEMIIPRSEWRDRYEEMKRDKSFLGDIVKASGWSVFDQANTNFCWANAVVADQEIARLIANQPHVRLSSASVASPITNYRNIGGWGSDALKYTINNGTATDETWPNAMVRPSAQAIREADEERSSFVTVEYYTLKNDDRMFDRFMSALFRRWPCAPGYDHWRHQVAATDPWLSPNNKWGCHGPNSWSSNWGENGWYYLEGSKADPDDCTCIHSVTPS